MEFLKNGKYSKDSNSLLGIKSVDDVARLDKWQIEMVWAFGV